MRLTEQEKELFSTLKEQAVTRRLIKFIERMCDDLCDIRKIGKVTPETYQARLDMVKTVEVELLARLKGKALTSKDKNQYI